MQTIEDLKWANRMYLGGHKSMSELCVRFGMSQNAMRDAWEEMGLTAYQWLKKGRKERKKSTVEHSEKVKKVVKRKVEKCNKVEAVTDAERKYIIRLKEAGHSTTYICRVVGRGQETVRRTWVSHLKGSTK